MQSFDLQRVLEGEKALRSEATRQLKEVEKKLVSLRSPAVALSSPMPAPPGSERTLEADKAMLQDQIKAHSAQVCFTCPNLPARVGCTHLFVMHLVLQCSTRLESEWSLWHSASSAVRPSALSYLADFTLAVEANVICGLSGQ